MFRITVLAYLLSLLCCLECAYLGGHPFYRPHPYPSSYAYHPRYYPQHGFQSVNYSPYQPHIYGPHSPFYHHHNRHPYPFPGGGTPVYTYNNKRCDGNYVGLQPFPDQRQYYYVCKPDGVIFGKCGNLQTFDSSIGKCIAYPQRGSPLSCKKEGRYPILSDCTMYYRCDRTMTPKIVSCPRGRVFNATENECILGSECRPTEISSQGNFQSENCEEKFPPCDAEGVFRSPTDCALYFNCTLSQNNSFLQTRYKCPDDKFWDIGEKSCLPKQQVACDCVTIAECIYPRPAYQPYILSQREPYRVVSQISYPVEEPDSPEYNSKSREYQDEASEEVPSSNESTYSKTQLASLESNPTPQATTDSAVPRATGTASPTAAAAAASNADPNTPSEASAPEYQSAIEPQAAVSSISTEPPTPAEEPTLTKETSERAVTPAVDPLGETPATEEIEIETLFANSDFEDDWQTGYTPIPTTPTHKPTQTHPPSPTFTDPEAIRDSRSTAELKNTNHTVEFQNGVVSEFVEASSPRTTPLSTTSTTQNESTTQTIGVDTTTIPSTTSQEESSEEDSESDEDDSDETTTPSTISPLSQDPSTTTNDPPTDHTEKSVDENESTPAPNEKENENRGDKNVEEEESPLSEGMQQATDPTITPPTTQHIPSTTSQEESSEEDSESDEDDSDETATPSTISPLFQDPSTTTDDPPTDHTEISDDDDESASEETEEDNSMDDEDSTTTTPVPNDSHNEIKSVDLDAENPIIPKTPTRTSIARMVPKSSDSKLFARSTITTTQTSITPLEKEIDNTIDDNGEFTTIPPSTRPPIELKSSPRPFNPATTQPTSTTHQTDTITPSPRRTTPKTPCVTSNVNTHKKLVAHLKAQNLELSVHNGFVKIRSNDLQLPVNNTSSNFTANETAACPSHKVPKLKIDIKDDIDLEINFCPPHCEEDHSHNFDPKNRAVDLTWYTNESNKTFGLESAN